MRKYIIIILLTCALKLDGLVEEILDEIKESANVSYYVVRETINTYSLIIYKAHRLEFFSDGISSYD